MAGEKKERVVQTLPAGFTGKIGKVMVVDRYGKKKGEFLLVHAATDGKTRCGNDTIGVTDDGILAWKATTGEVTCGRCLRGLTKDAQKPATARKVAKAGNPKGATKSAASTIQRSKSAEASRAYRERKKAQGQ